MKIFIIYITFLFVIGSKLTLVAQSFEKGQTDLNIGLGIGNAIIATGSANVFPPLGAALEYGITDDISIGGYLGFTGASYSYYGWDNCGMSKGMYYTDTYRWSYFIIGARAAYHFGRFIQIDKLDVYAGLLLGDDFAHASYSTTSTCPDHIQYVSPTYGGVVFSLYGGARYRFTDRVGAFGELGFGIAYLNLGVNFKF